MGQVPEKSYGLIGHGRVAKHISNYFTLLNIPHKIWSRGLSLEFIKECSVILILISDSEIQSFADQNWNWLKLKQVAHFSGSLTLGNIPGFHPLMTFSRGLYDLKTYESISFVGEKGGNPFESLFPKLRNPCFYIQKDSKAFYHAMCVIGGNFSTLLWQSFFSELSKRWDIPKEAALPYLKQVTSNLVLDAEGALTGPLQRKDFGTIKRNLKALTDQGPDQKLLKIYNAFVEAYT